MKDYEFETRTSLPPRSYTIIRLDGRAFHTYLKNADKPFDYGFAADMQEVTEFLCAEVAGSVFAYTQSDEISILLQDFASPGTEPWFGGEVQKIVSTSAALATAKLNNLRTPPGEKFATFDSRVFTLPSVTEVANYFLWRQKDAVRNAVSMAAQAQYSHKELHGKGQNSMLHMLMDRGIEFDDDYPAHVRFGSVVVQEQHVTETTWTNKRTGETNTTESVRNRWVAEAAPGFSATEGFLLETIPEKKD